MREALETLIAFVETKVEAVMTPTGLPRVDIFRVTRPTELLPEIYAPFVSLILRGEKRLLIGNRALKYGAGDTFISSVDLPAVGEVVEASASNPYLAVRLIFDPAITADLLRDVPGPAARPDTQSFRVDRASADLVDALLRMVRLMDRPYDIAVMAPLLEREILFRLLRGPQADVLLQVAGTGGRFPKIRNAVRWIRTNYASPFRIEGLAEMATMSQSAFHRGFKASTGLSPLQYQKHLRLYEARRLLLASPGDVASVAFAVGYESLSQFTREYARMFGAPPARDIKQFRANG